MNERVSAKTEAKKENKPYQTQKADLSQSISSNAEQILFLQRTIGNQACTKLIESGALRTKLKMGKSWDIYEQEANRVVERAMRMPAHVVQRGDGTCEVPSWCEKGALKLPRMPAHDSVATTRIAVQRTEGQLTSEIRERQNALRRINELLSTDIFDWAVTDEEAHAVLDFLKSLRPEILLYTVMVMRMTGKWRIFRRELPETDREALYQLDLTIDPNVGYLMPQDTIVIEIHTRSTRENLGRTDFRIESEGVHLPYLLQPIPVAGLLPQAAANKIARAYIDALIFVEPVVRVGIHQRGIHYIGANCGPFESPIFINSTLRAPTSRETQRQRKQEEFMNYIAGVSSTEPMTTAAIHHYLAWIESNYPRPEFLTRTPVELWEWALHRATQPVPHSPLQPFLSLVQSMTNRLNDLPGPERGRTQEAITRYLAWLDLHRQDPDISSHDPVEIWSRAYLNAFREELEQTRIRTQRGTRERANAIDWSRVERKFDEALHLTMTQIWRMPPPRAVVDPTPRREGPRGEEGDPHRVTYLITGSETERGVRDHMARAFLDDIVRRMPEPNFTATSAAADFSEWLRQHPQERLELGLAQAHPEVERFTEGINIPAWQTTIEIGIGFIPIVGQIVAGYEVIAGEDIFGNPLSTTDRAILAASILLPAAGRIFRVGRAAVTASRLAREYSLSAREAEALFRATAQLAPSSTGARLLTLARDDVLAGRPVRDPQRLQQLEILMRDMGMTDRSTGQALREPRASVIHGGHEAAEDVTRHSRSERVTTGEGGGEHLSPPSGGGGGGATGATLLQRQRGAALRTEAASLEREVASLRGEAERLERTAEGLQATRPDRAARMQQQAGRRRRVADILQRDITDLRREATEFESGARSATSDLPGPEDIDLLLGEARAETEMIQIPLARAERNPELLPRLVRPLLQSRSGNRVVFRVESGGSRELIRLSPTGDVAIRRGTSVHFNFGSFDRAVEFLRQNRSAGARIIAFEVDEAWVRSIRSGAIPEHGTGTLHGQPRLVDIRFAEDQMEIPDRLLEEFMQFIIPGSGRVLTMTP